VSIPSTKALIKSFENKPSNPWALFSNQIKEKPKRKKYAKKSRYTQIPPVFYIKDGA
jgi:hypothetical protein